MSTRESDVNNIALSVIDVTRDNFTAMWPVMLFAIKSSTFVALDLELSGLGDRKQLKASSVEDRYIGLCKIAKSRSVISLGLSCFQEVNSAAVGNNKQVLKAQAFNLLLLCNDEYTVESQSLSFLVNHGFDFNKQYSLGIPYSKGNQKEVVSKASIRQLMAELILAKKPVILHNGFIDLVFLYECFYTNLPSTLRTFVADLCEMFPTGIIDTKYISEFHSRESLSVLEYLFRKCQFNNKLASLNKEEAVFIEIDAVMPCQTANDSHEIVHCTLPTIEVTHTLKQYIPLLCKNFEMRGFCPLETSCPKIHSVALIIASEDLADHKQRERRRRRKRKASSLDAQEKSITVGINDVVADTNPTTNKNGNAETKNKHCLDDHEDQISEETKESHNGVQNGTDLPAINKKHLLNTHEGQDSKAGILTKESFDNIVLPRLNGHRAGFDAFMTGYCFAFYKLNLADSFSMQELSNKIYLTAKDVPLHVVKSHFAKTSPQHQQMMKFMN